MDIKSTIVKVLEILEESQDSYIDPAEHIYDGVKIIKRKLDNKDLKLHVKDFILSLSSSTNRDFDGTLEKCINMLKAVSH